MKSGYTWAIENEKRFLLDGRVGASICMDMEQVLIIGASGGIGSALRDAVSSQGFAVRSLSRSVDGLDLTDEVSVDHHLSGLRDFSGVIIASGALEIDGSAPEKSIKAIKAKAMADQFALNAVGPALVLKHAPHLLRRDARSVFAVLSARVGSIGDNRLGGWVSYRAAKAAVNQVIRTGAIELARTHPQAVCVSIHPGTVQTEFTRKYLGRASSVPPREAAQNIMNVLNGLGAEDTGKFFDWAGKDVPW